MRKCKYFNSCNAPICPLYEHKDKTIWYPDEDICKLKEFSSLQWIQNQKKIKKKVIDKTTYYTIKMLDRKFVIGSKLKGLDPNKPEDKQIEKWFKAHPEKKPLSKERKKELRERMLKLRKKIKIKDKPSKKKT